MFRMRAPSLAAMLAVAASFGLAGCGAPPPLERGVNRSIEFVQARPGGEGLMFRLPPGYRQVKRGQLPGGMPFQTYLPAGEPDASRRLFLEVMVVPGAILSAKGLVTAEQNMILAAMGLRNTCPTTFNVSVQGPIRSALGPRHGPPPAPNAPDFAVIQGCGRTPNGQSEVTLLAGFRDGGDLFMLNWTERGAPQDGGRVPLDEGLWLSRLRQLQPLRLCAAAQGGSGPGPDCVMEAIGSVPAPR
jgi:hypothetical protein